MTTETYLWAIFALLWVALILTIVTARRGPWKPQEPLAGPLARTVQRWERQGISHVRVIRGDER